MHIMSVVLKLLRQHPLSRSKQAWNKFSVVSLSLPGASLNFKRLANQVGYSTGCHESMAVVSTITSYGILLLNQPFTHFLRFVYTYNSQWCLNLEIWQFWGTGRQADGSVYPGICIQVWFLVLIWLIHLGSPEGTTGMTCCHLWLSTFCI